MKTPSLKSVLFSLFIRKADEDIQLRSSYVHSRCLKLEIMNVSLSVCIYAAGLLLSSCLPDFKWQSHLHGLSAQKRHKLLPPRRFPITCMKQREKEKPLSHLLL